MMNANWMVKHANVYRSFLAEVVGVSAEELRQMDFNELSKAIKPYIRSTVYAPYKQAIYNLRG